jgi:hypothetical protein
MRSFTSLVLLEDRRSDPGRRLSSDFEGAAAFLRHAAPTHHQDRVQPAKGRKDELSQSAHFAPPDAALTLGRIMCGLWGWGGGAKGGDDGNTPA